MDPLLAPWRILGPAWLPLWPLVKVLVIGIP